jgi:hypothetical protein
LVPITTLPGSAWKPMELARAVPLGVASDGRWRQRHPGAGRRTPLAEGAPHAQQHGRANIVHQLAILGQREAELAQRDLHIGIVDLDDFRAH